METVAKLDEDHADILGHGQKHLTDILHLRFFLILDIDILQFGQSVHQKRHIVTEPTAQNAQVGLIGAILHRIVQKGGTNGIRIQSQRSNDLRYRDRMGNIRITAVAELPFVQFGGVLIRRLDFFQIIVFPAGFQHGKQFIRVHGGMYFIGHTITTYLLRFIRDQPVRPRAISAEQPIAPDRFFPGCGYIRIDRFPARHPPHRRAKCASHSISSE